MSKLSRLTALFFMAMMLAVSARAEPMDNAAIAANADSVIAAETECVVLLHGLARVSNSMGELERKLGASGFTAVNVHYKSRSYSIDVLAEDAVGRGITQCDAVGAATIHFVTHSLGGILVRFYLSQHQLSSLGRVVMLGPPNQGSEVVDQFDSVPGFEFITGPAGIKLGTQEDSVPRQLGPVDFDLGVIAGNSSITPTSLVLPGDDDGLVAVESTRVEGMNAHIVLPVTHTFMMRNNEVIEQVIHYLNQGVFM